MCVVDWSVASESFFVAAQEWNFSRPAENYIEAVLRANTSLTHRGCSKFIFGPLCPCGFERNILLEQNPWPIQTQPDMGSHLHFSPVTDPLARCRILPLGAAAIRHSLAPLALRPIQRFCPLPRWLKKLCRRAGLAQMELHKRFSSLRGEDCVSKF